MFETFHACLRKDEKREWTSQFENTPTLNCCGFSAMRLRPSVSDMNGAMYEFMFITHFEKGPLNKSKLSHLSM